MPKCPSCNWYTPGDDKAICGHCGAAFIFDTPVVWTYAESSAVLTNALACPQCGDLALAKKVTAIVTDGVAFSSGHSSTLGGAAGHLLVAGTNTRGVTQSALSAQFAPPHAPTLGFMASMFGAKQKDKDAQAEWRRRLQRWNCLYYCGRCDVVFDPWTRRYTSRPAWRSLLLFSAE